jgi:hypothetical protein
MIDESTIGTGCVEVEQTTVWFASAAHCRQLMARSARPGNTSKR